MSFAEHSFLHLAFAVQRTWQCFLASSGQRDLEIVRVFGQGVLHIRLRVNQVHLKFNCRGLDEGDFFIQLPVEKMEDLLIKKEPYEFCREGIFRRHPNGGLRY